MSRRGWAVARNKVQFQKGLSETRFDELYGTEELCRAVVFCWRWPEGFICPGCGGREHCVVKTRALYQCTACRRQTSLIAGSIFAATKLPLRVWFRAMYHLTQSKGGISSLELGRRLGVTQTTAWKIKHKLMQVMMERDAGKRLAGRIEIDDAYIGGERNGGRRGRGAAGKTPIVAAVETTPEGKPVRIKLRRVKGFRRKALETLAKRNFDPASTIVSDGLRCFTGVGTIRNFVRGGAVANNQAMAIVQRSPNRTANWALAMEHSRGGMIPCFSARFNTRKRSVAAASSVGKWPLARTARRRVELSASIAFVVYKIRRTSPGTA
jgi:hypothetical protein